VSAAHDRGPPDGPLFERDDALGALLREGNRELEQHIDQRRALIALDARIERKKRAWLRGPAWAVAVPVLALGLFYLWAPRDGSLAAGLRLEPETQLVPRAKLTRREPPVEPARDGKTVLPDGSSMQVSRDSRVHWRSTVGGIRVQLDAGEVRCAVNAQHPGKRFVVDAGAYSFVALGHELKVQRGKDGAQVDVYRGRVEVRKGAQRVATVEAGGSWSERVASEPSESRAEVSHREAPRVVAPETKPVPPSTPEPAQDCGAHVKAQAFHVAAECYQKQSQGQGLSAEFALFELARLRSSALNDRAGAVRALEEHQRRFAAGALAHQVQLALERARSSGAHPAGAVQPLAPKAP
jgi:hypothetical protein